MCVSPVFASLRANVYITSHEHQPGSRVFGRVMNGSFVSHGSRFACKRQEFECSAHKHQESEYTLEGNFMRNGGESGEGDELILIRYNYMK